MLNSAQRRHLLGFADSLNHQYNSLVQNQHQFYLRIIFSLLTTSEPSQYCLLLSLVTFDTREGLEEEGRGATIQLLTPAPRPCISPSSVKSPPPLEHGLDLRTSCFLAATASLLSSFTRDSDLEGEPLLADTTLVVHKSHVFTLSASQNFMNFGFWSFGLFSFGFPLLLLNCWSWRMLWRCYCPRPDSLNSTFLGKNIKNLYYIIAYETEGFQIKVPMGKISLLYIQYHN